MNIKKLPGEIDRWCNALVTRGNVIPDANKKNVYLKACWLLAYYQKAVKHHSPVAADNIKTLTEALPVLRNQVHA